MSSFDALIRALDTQTTDERIIAALKESIRRFQDMVDNPHTRCGYMESVESLAELRRILEEGVVYQGVGVEKETK